MKSDRKKIDREGRRPRWSATGDAVNWLLAGGVLLILTLAYAIASDTDRDAPKNAGRPPAAAPAPDATTESPDPTSSPSASGTTCDTPYQVEEEVGVGVVLVSLDDASTPDSDDVMRSLKQVKEDMRCRTGGRISIAPEFVGTAEVRKEDVRCDDVSQWGRDADADVGIDADAGAPSSDVTLYVVSGAPCKRGRAVSRHDTYWGNPGDAYAFDQQQPVELVDVLGKAIGKSDGGST